MHEELENLLKDLEPSVQEDLKEYLYFMRPKLIILPDPFCLEYNYTEGFEYFNIPLPTSPKYPYYAIRFLRMPLIIKPATSATPGVGETFMWHSKPPKYSDGSGCGLAYNWLDYRNFKRHYLKPCYYCNESFSVSLGTQTYQPKLFCSNKCKHEAPNGAELNRIHDLAWKHFEDTWNSDFLEAEKRLEELFFQAFEESKERKERIKEEKQEEADNAVKIIIGIMIVLFILLMFLI